MEFDEIVVKESPGLCRCCLSEGCYKDMGTEYSWMNDNEVYADMLLECFDISISQHNDGPNGPNRLICEVCITRLRDACYFKKQVLDSEKKFVDMIGRGEFRPKVLFYQAQLKSEAVDETPADDAEVEYLEDEMDFGDDEPLKSLSLSLEADSEAGADAEAPADADVTASPLPARAKRGRPKKTALKTEKKKLKTEKTKTKTVVKGLLPTSKAENQIEMSKRTQYAQLIRTIVEYSSMMPFRWHECKYQCFYCSEHFMDSSKLRKHVNDHSDVDIIEILKRTLYNRKGVKLDVSNVWCSMCVEQMCSFADYIRHLKAVHNQIFLEEVVSHFDLYKLTDYDMRCLECGEKFMYFNKLLVHVNRMHVNVEKSHKFLCDVCGQGYADYWTLRNHINQTHNLKRCKFCGDTFQTRYGLDNHLGSVHQTEKLQCPICFKNLATRYMKKRHMAFVHDCKNMQFSCKICKKMFTRRNKLDIHRRRKHLKERNFSCDSCGAKFFDRISLKRHMIAHTEGRPYACDACGKSFRRKLNLVAHIKKVHDRVASD